MESINKIRSPLVPHDDAAKLGISIASRSDDAATLGLIRPAHDKASRVVHFQRPLGDLELVPFRYAQSFHVCPLLWW